MCYREDFRVDNNIIYQLLGGRAGIKAEDIAGSKRDRPELVIAASIAIEVLFPVYFSIPQQCRRFA